MNALLAPYARSSRRCQITDHSFRPDSTTDTAERPTPPSEDRQRAVTAFIVPALLGENADLTHVVDRIAARVDEDVCCWSPALFTQSRTELVSALVDGDDAITHVSVMLSSIALVGSTSFVEWEMRGRFSRPFFLDDDLMIEPTGRAVTSCGVMVLEFAGERVGDIRCYYDALELDEQLVHRDEQRSARR